MSLHESVLPVGAEVTLGRWHGDPNPITGKVILVSGDCLYVQRTDPHRTGHGVIVADIVDNVVSCTATHSTDCSCLES